VDSLFTEQNISYSPHAKYLRLHCSKSHHYFLEIILDAKMSGKYYFLRSFLLIHKGSVLIDILTSLSETWWGSHPHLLLNLYRSIFRGSIEYGCQIFRFNGNKKIFSKLERLQFHAIRVAMDYCMSTLINVMLFEAKKVPLRFILLICKFLIKSLAKEFNPVIESLDNLRLMATHRKTCISLLRSFLIFKHYISTTLLYNIIITSFITHLSFLNSFSTLTQF